MKIRILSDLHFEFQMDGGKSFVEGLKTRGTDLLILAGDITTMAVGIDRSLRLFRQAFSCPIVVLNGNHEFYGSNRPTVLRAMHDAVSKLQGVHWLDCDIFEFKGKRVLGTPLWFGRQPMPKHPLLISTEEEWHVGVYRTVTEKGVMETTFHDFEDIEGYASWVYDENARAKKFLTEHMKKGDIVITHHLPTQRSVADQFKGALSNCWFVSDITELIEEREPALMIHGHTHGSQDYFIGPTRVVCNPLGYVSSGHLNSSFDEDFIVEIP